MTPQALKKTVDEPPKPVSERLRIDTQPPLPLPGIITYPVNPLKDGVAVEWLPELKSLGSLASHPSGDPAELLKYRFLCRCGICLLLGPTGIGKSSFLMQLAIYLAVAKALFGITPGDAFIGRGMRILMVQAENDEGDLCEMRDGVLLGCKDLTEAEKALAVERIMVCTVNDRSGDRFALALEALLAKHGTFDLVIADPALAYVGGDSNSQKDVGHFMRELLTPILHRQNVGMILSHHVNKPSKGMDKDNWKAGDFAYLGAGSAEWINPARAALAIRSIGSDTVFELRAVKRGTRLRWQNANSVATLTRFISHHGDPGVICWREVEESEALNNKQCPSVDQVLAQVPSDRPITKDALRLKANGVGIAWNRINGLIAQLLDAGRLFEWLTRRPGTREEKSYCRKPQPQPEIAK